MLWTGNATDSVEIYRKGSSSWYCTDGGRYLQICGRSDLPDTIECKKLRSCNGEILWECSPSRGTGWKLIHNHICTIHIDDKRCWETCTLHTIATPQHDLDPILVIVGTFFLLTGIMHLYRLPII